MNGGKEEARSKKRGERSQKRRDQMVEDRG